MRNIGFAILAAVLSPLLLLAGVALMLFAGIDFMLGGHASGDSYWTWP